MTEEHRFVRLGLPANGRSRDWRASVMGPLLVGIRKSEQEQFAERPGHEFNPDWEPGIIEAGCKTVVGHRFKQSGMFWTVNGANSSLALRCSHLNGRFQHYGASRHAA